MESKLVYICWVLPCSHVLRFTVPSYALKATKNALHKRLDCTCAVACFAGWLIVHVTLYAVVVIANY